MILILNLWWNAVMSDWVDKIICLSAVFFLPSFWQCHKLTDYLRIRYLLRQDKMSWKLFLWCLDNNGIVSRSHTFFVIVREQKNRLLRHSYHIEDISMWCHKILKYQKTFLGFKAFHAFLFWFMKHSSLSFGQEVCPSLQTVMKFAGDIQSPKRMIPCLS